MYCDLNMGHTFKRVLLFLHFIIEILKLCACFIMYITHLQRSTCVSLINKQMYIRCMSVRNISERQVQILKFLEFFKDCCSRQLKVIKTFKWEKIMMKPIF